MNRRTAVVLAAAGLGAAVVALAAADRGGRPAPANLPPPLGTMDFELTDDRGAVVRPRDLVGRPAPVFFGFTYCPEICPTTLGRVGAWLDELGARADPLQRVLVTVDPERDTAAALSEYVAAFDPALRGSTGTPEQIARAADAFGVAFRKVPLDGGDYSMDHTATVFLFKADGTFASTIDYHEQPDAALAKLARLLR